LLRHIIERGLKKASSSYLPSLSLFPLLFFHNRAFGALDWERKKHSSSLTKPGSDRRTFAIEPSFPFSFSFPLPSPFHPPMSGGRATLGSGHGVYHPRAHSSLSRAQSPPLFFFPLSSPSCFSGQKGKALPPESH